MDEMISRIEADRAIRLFVHDIKPLLVEMCRKCCINCSWSYVKDDCVGMICYNHSIEVRLNDCCMRWRQCW